MPSMEASLGVKLIMGLQSLFLWMRLLPRNGVDIRD